MWKIKGDDNPADLFTKHLCQENMERCLKFLGAEYREGRADVAPQRKDDEELIADNGDWNQQEELREEMEYDDIETRLTKQEEIEDELVQTIIQDNNELEQLNMLSELPCSGMSTPRSTGSSVLIPNIYKNICNKDRQ